MSYAEGRSHCRPSLPICVVVVDVLAPVAAGSDVGKGLCEFETQGAGHQFSLIKCDGARLDPVFWASGPTGGDGYPSGSRHIPAYTVQLNRLRT